MKRLVLVVALVSLSSCSPTAPPEDYQSQLLRELIEAQPGDVIEIPAGTTAKWEVEEDGVMRWELENGKPRVVQYLGYPANYGMVPRTLLPKEMGGDGDPLDICVVSERPIVKAEVILDARVVGGLQMLDQGEADDQIVAVLANDNIWGSVNDIAELPEVLIERLRHYFSTYKLVAEQSARTSIQSTYDRSRAERVIEAAMEDYADMFGE